MDWKDFLDEDFNGRNEKYTTRDYVITQCTRCKTNSRIQVANLKKQIKKKNTHLCWTCSISVAKSNKPEYKTKIKNHFQEYNVKLKDQTLETFLENASSKEYYIFVCNECGTDVRKQLNTVLQKKYPVRCRSCGGKASITKNAIEKKKKTLKNKYGVENPMQNTSIAKKAKETSQKKYGEGGSQAIARRAFKEKYGVKNPFNIPEIQQKIKQTNLEKYGAVNKKRKKLLNKFDVKSEQEAAAKLIAFLEKTGYPCNHPKVLEKFQTTGTVLTRMLNKFERTDLLHLDKTTSQGEKELFAFVESLGKIHNFTTLANIREIISPSELDIYIPEKKLAIEYNGLYWHSLKTQNMPVYHKLKREYCEKEGIRLLQFQDNEWQNKQDIVKSMITHVLGESPHKIGARSTELRIVNRLDAMAFLEENHLMGGSPRGTSFIGLYFKDKLLTLLSYKKYKEGIDIVRFCNKLNYSVLGGLSKCIKYLERTHKDSEFIQSYVDLRYGTGQSLLHLGFERESTFLSWKWTDFKNTYNRLQCRANMDSRGLSESDHADELGWVRIYDAGQSKYIKRKG